MQRRDIAQRSPDVIALMIASEFSRAASRCAHRDNVLKCYARAQELFGVMETLPLSEETALLFHSLYRQCASDRLVAEAYLAPEIVEKLGTELAEAFQRVAEKLQAARMPAPG